MTNSEQYPHITRIDPLFESYKNERYVHEIRSLKRFRSTELEIYIRNFGSFQIWHSLDSMGNWIQWIMEITKSAFFSILVNGSPSSIFSPSIGIRQGDTLSPFLFILMAEGLGQLIIVTVTTNQITGLKLHPRSPTSSHQEFFDDTMFLGKQTIYEVESFKSILKTFELASRLEINLSKS